MWPYIPEVQWITQSTGHIIHSPWIASVRPFPTRLELVRRWRNYYYIVPVERPMHSMNWAIINIAPNSDRPIPRADYQIRTGHLAQWVPCHLGTLARCGCRSKRRSCSHSVAIASYMRPRLLITLFGHLGNSTNARLRGPHQEKMFSVLNALSALNQFLRSLRSLKTGWILQVQNKGIRNLPYGIRNIP